MPRYKLRVSYIGTRFHGFQRQMTNETKMKKNHGVSVEESTSPLPVPLPFYRACPKRPKLDRETGVPTRLASTITVQDCLEDACLAFVATNQNYLTPTSLGATTTDSNKDNDKHSNKSTTTTGTSNGGTDDMSSPTPYTLEALALRFAGRTDKGVHARGQVVTIQLPTNIAFPIACKTPVARSQFLRRSLNSRLPLDISVEDVEELVELATCHRDRVNAASVMIDFDPRRHVKSKMYSYTLKYQRWNKQAIDSPPVSSDTGRNPDRPALPEARSININSNNDDFSKRSIDKTTTDMDTTSGHGTTHRDALGYHGIRSAWDSPCIWICPWVLNQDALFPILCQNLQGMHNYRAFVHRDDRDKQSQVLRIDRIEPITLQVETYEMDSLPFATTVNNGRYSNNQQSSWQPSTIEVVTLRLEFQATGFRRSLIRNLVGFCVDLCRGQITLTQLGGWDTIWTGTDKVATHVNAAPACGLCLERVWY